MENWEVEGKLAYILPTAWKSQETQNIAVTLVSPMPSLPLAINSFRDSIQSFSPWLHHFDRPFSLFLPQFKHSVQVHALANLFSIPKSEWVSQCISSWELPCQKSSHFYHYVWEEDGQYIACTSQVTWNILVSGIISQISAFRYLTNIQQIGGVCIFPSLLVSSLQNPSTGKGTQEASAL